VNLDRIFDALASGPRREILARLSEGALTTTELAQAASMSAPAMSRHLSVLENAGLVASRRHGQRVLYSLVRDTLMEALSGFTADLGSSPPEEIKVKREAI
jgi:DNA-binding transcriptional ArsR family regulator